MKVNIEDMTMNEYMEMIQGNDCQWLDRKTIEAMTMIEYEEMVRRKDGLGSDRLSNATVDRQEPWNFYLEDSADPPFPEKKVLEVKACDAKRDLPIVTPSPPKAIVEPYCPPVPFPNRLKLTGKFVDSIPSVFTNDFVKNMQEEKEKKKTHDAHENHIFTKVDHFYFSDSESEDEEQDLERFEQVCVYDEYPEEFDEQIEDVMSNEVQEREGQKVECSETSSTIDKCSKFVNSFSLNFSNIFVELEQEELDENWFNNLLSEDGKGFEKECLLVNTSSSFKNFNSAQELKELEDLLIDTDMPLTDDISDFSIKDKRLEESISFYVYTVDPHKEEEEWVELYPLIDSQPEWEVKLLSRNSPRNLKPTGMYRYYHRHKTSSVEDDSRLSGK